LGDGEIVDIAAFAGKHFERTKRPLRIAIDEASWRFNFFQSKESVARIRKGRLSPKRGRLNADIYLIGCPMANPNEKNVLWPVLELLRLNCQLVFVSDGPGRPKKRGRIPRETHTSETALLKETMEHLGIPWHKAPGEAEAECAELQKLGVADAVWTDDGDALMFGCTTLIRFFRKPNGKKDLEKVRVYKSKRIVKQYRGLDREGLVLLAVLSGGDYNKAGLPGCGTDKALKGVAHGLGQALCLDNLDEFRNQLIDFYMCKGLKIPDNFPNPAHVKNYNKPLVSEPEMLRMLQNRWDKALDEPFLWRFLVLKYNLGAEKFIDLILPILFVRSLAQTCPGQESSNAGYKIKHISRSGPGLSTVSLVLSAITSITTMDIDSWLQNTSLPNPSWRPQHRVEFHRILDCIISHGCPDAMKGVPAPVIKPTKKPSSLLSTRKRERISKVEAPEAITNPAKRVRRSPTPEKPTFRRLVDISEDEFDEFDRLYLNQPNKPDERLTPNLTHKKERGSPTLRDSPRILPDESDLFVRSKTSEKERLDTDSESLEHKILDKTPIRWEEGPFLDFMSRDDAPPERPILDFLKQSTKTGQPQKIESHFSLTTKKGTPLQSTISSGNHGPPKASHSEDMIESSAPLSPATLRRARLKRFENISKSSEEILSPINTEAIVEKPQVEIVRAPATAIGAIGRSKSSLQDSPLEVIKIQDTFVEVIDLT
jgi:Holliday junction resolvase YEN1